MGRVILSTTAASLVLIAVSALHAQRKQNEPSDGTPASARHKESGCQIAGRSEYREPEYWEHGAGDANDSQSRSPQRLDQWDDSKIAPQDGTDIGQQNPLVQIGGQMRQVERRLAAGDVSHATQESQRQILSELDELMMALAATQQQSQQQRKSSSSSPAKQQASKTGKQAAEDSQGPLGRDSPTEEEIAARREAVAEIWGHLPERIRRQMQSAGAVEFLPKYRKLIEDYYKRLAEDRDIHQ